MSRHRPSGKLPILVGESPSRTGDQFWRWPLSGAVAQTLCTAAGIKPLAEGTRYGKWTWRLYEHFDCVNLVQRWADAERWSVGHARERAELILSASPAVPTVLLGRRVGEAFGLVDAGFGTWCLVAGRQVVVAPHPSTRNRMLNASENVAVLRRALVEAMERTGDGRRS